MSSNDEYSTDDSKRKRDSSDLGAFKGSKKIARSPVKMRENDKKLDEIFQLLKAVSLDVQQIRNEQQEIRREMKELKDENNKMKHENELLKLENEKIKKNIATLNVKTEQLDKEKRKKNVVVTGLEVVKENENKLKEVMRDFIKENLQIETAITSANRLGKETYLVSFENIEEKWKVMEQKGKLRNLKDQRVYINNDQTTREREIQKCIREVAAQEEQKGNQVKIGYQKLKIGDDEWKWSNENDRLEKQTRSRDGKK